MTRRPELFSHPDADRCVRDALQEDLGPEGLDVTSAGLIPCSEQATAWLVTRARAVVSGLPVVERVFRQVDPSLLIEPMLPDGTRVDAGETLMKISGSARSILMAERTALNFIQRMTGIATLTRQYVDEANNPAVQILDTRKTTPGLRLFEKYAVVCGGGCNHRFGLFDRVLIKDNHLAHWVREGGTLAAAVETARAAYPDLLIEVEVDTVEQLREVLPARPDWILLDNMPPLVLRECVKLCEGICKTEASGGVTLKTIREIAKTGVSAVSVGALTHSAPSIDLALDFA